MINLKLKNLIILSLMPLFAVGCASSNTMSHSEKTTAYTKFIADEKLESQSRVSSFRIDGWSSLNDEFLIINVGVNRNYLLSLKNTCFNLRFANNIKVNKTGSSISAKFDSITAYPIDGGPPRCFIKEIHKITREQKRALQKIGKLDKEEKV